MRGLFICSKAHLPLILAFFPLSQTGGGRAVEEGGVGGWELLFLGFLDPEKEDTYEEELLVAKWAQIYKPEPSRHFYIEGSPANHTSGRSLH